jgi:molecular chaperone GrpE
LAVAFLENTRCVDWREKYIWIDTLSKRQVRRAGDAVAVERGRLLSLMLPIADILTRALDQGGHVDETLRQGVELTQRELMRLLEAEGVTRLETVGYAFTPELHEAVATVMTKSVAAGTVVEEVESGYKLGDRLLRPARVVVSV